MDAKCVNEQQCIVCVCVSIYTTFSHQSIHVECACYTNSCLHTRRSVALEDLSDASNDFNCSTYLALSDANDEADDEDDELPLLLLLPFKGDFVGLFPFQLLLFMMNDGDLCSF